MTIEEAILEKLRELPPERQQEVLDFAEFLHQKHQNTEDTFTAYVEYDPETKLYVGIIPGVVGAHTQAENLDELQANLKEVLELCLEEYGEDLDNLPRFVGIQTIEVGA